MKKTKFKILSFILVMSFVLPLCPTLGVTAQEKTDALVVSEVTELRRSNEKHFLCSDGSVMAVSFPEDVHYLDNNGKYVTIDNTLEYNSSKGVYRTAGNPNFKVSFANKANQPSYSLEDKAGNILQAYTTVEVLSLSASATREASLKTASLEVTNNKKVELKGKSKNDAAVFEVPELTSKLEYKNTYGAGISSEYIVDGNILKENIIFASPANYSSIKTTYSMEGLSLSVSEDGSLILYGEDGGAVFYVAAPYMYDAAGSVCPAVAVSASESGGVWTVSYVPDREWRNSPERVYPVTFDPATGSVMNSNITDKYSMSGGGTTSVVTNGYLMAGMEAYNTSSTAYYYRTYIQPTEYPTVPEGNTVVGTGLILSASSVYGSGFLELTKIGGEADFDNNNYTFSGFLGAIEYNSSNAKTSYTFELPASEYRNCGDGYIIRDSSETTVRFGQNYVVFHSSRATLSSERPKTSITYVPKGLNNLQTTLYNPETERYLTSETNTTLGTAVFITEESLWKFIPIGTGTYRIAPVLYNGVCLSASQDGSVSLVTNTTVRSALWYVTVEGDTCYIINEQYGNKLYIDTTNGTYTGKISIDNSENNNQYKWKIKKTENAYTSIANASADGFMVVSSAGVLNMSKYIIKEEPWKFVLAGNQMYRIVPGGNSNMCLSANSNGTVSLATRTSSSSDTSQLWTVTKTTDGFFIKNVAQNRYLYAKTDNSGNFTYGLDTTGSQSTSAQRQWKMMNYYVPEVATLSSVKNSNLVLRNRSGYDTAMLLSTGKDTREASLEALWQYKKDPSTLNSSRLFEVESEVYGDMYGFRLVLDENTDSYRIMPISSSNGEHRAAARKSNDTVVMDIYKKQDGSINTDDLNSMLFDFILRSDGKFHIKYHASSSPIYLSDRGEGIAVRLDPLYPTTPEPNSTDVITMQTWTLSDYEYKALNPDNFDTNVFNSNINIYTCLYTEIEEKCSEFGFSRPFAAGEELILTSDFGPRTYKLKSGAKKTDVHRGVDLYTTDEPIDLYSPIGGKVIYAAATGDDEDSYDGYLNAGNVIVINTGLQLSENSEYFICIVYMHMTDVNMDLWSETNTDIDDCETVTSGQWLGTSGDTGGDYDQHLHYGIFLLKETEIGRANATKWNDFPLNPLLFFIPIGYQENL